VLALRPRLEDERARRVEYAVMTTVLTIRSAVLAGMALILRSRLRGSTGIELASRTGGLGVDRQTVETFFWRRLADG
jgi:hypothetical protein